MKERQRQRKAGTDMPHIPAHTLLTSASPQDSLQNHAVFDLDSEPGRELKGRQSFFFFQNDTNPSVEMNCLDIFKVSKVT